MSSYTTGEEMRNAIAYATSVLLTAIDVETQEPGHRGQTIAAMGVAAGTLRVVLATYDTGEENQHQPQWQVTGEGSEGLDWKAVADCVVARRNWLNMSQLDVFKAGGPAEQTMRRIENNQRCRYATLTLNRLEKALKWELGTIASILRGTITDRRALIIGNTNREGTPAE